MQRFTILGAGGVGQLLAHTMRQYGFPVTILVRRPQLIQQFRAEGARLKCEGGGGRTSVYGADMELVSEAHGDIHNLIISTKANAVVDAVRSVQGRLQRTSSIILIQNGMLAVYEELWKQVLSGWDARTRPRVIVGSLSHGAYLRGSFDVFHSSFGTGSCIFAEVDAGLSCLADPLHQQKWSGPQSPALEAILSLHSLAPARPHSHSDMLRQIQLKLACNCALNPLTAILHCLNGELLQDVATRDAMRNICSEMFDALGASATASAEEMYQAACKVAAATAQNRSSMLQDVIAGRITELPYLNGFISKCGTDKKVPTPTNALLCQLVSFMERRVEHKTKEDS